MNQPSTSNFSGGSGSVNTDDICLSGLEEDTNNPASGQQIQRSFVNFRSDGNSPQPCGNQQQRFDQFLHNNNVPDNSTQGTIDSRSAQSAASGNGRHTIGDMLAGMSIGGHQYGSCSNNEQNQSSSSRNPSFGSAHQDADVVPVTTSVVARPTLTPSPMQLIYNSNISVCRNNKRSSRNDIKIESKKEKKKKEYR